jgi:hypothetical protein
VLEAIQLRPKHARKKRWNDYKVKVEPIL